MRQTLFLFFSFLLSQTVCAETPPHCENWPTWLKPVCTRPYQTWTEGDNELYIPGYAWHNRYQYSESKLGTYNENAWGGGLGKGFFDENGDWNGLYAFVFLESHSKVEPIAGYAFLKTFHIDESSSAGIGFTVFITSRPDIFNNIPFPGALPWASLNYRRISFIATYIPGSHNVGNVLFMLAKYTF
ncbi:MAG: lipid IV(A) palmitoyltransferase PagP [Gammaproteobacteria bacterium]|nr:lipid IV(A) palmitoyltransferase PagP [Gammaproteobacteria bacterium]